MKRDRRNGHVLLHLLWIGALIAAGYYVYLNYWPQIDVFLQNANEEARGTMTQLAQKIEGFFSK